MKRLLLCLLIMVCGSIGMKALGQTAVIGYCNDEIASTVHPVGIDAAGSNRISAAIYLPRTTMMHYQGMTITRLRFAVRQGFENVSVWIRSQLTTSSLVVQSATNIVNGWNEVELSNPFLADGSAIYIGYTATQPEGFEGILAHGEGNANTSWLAIDNQWFDYSEQGLGILYIQAVAEGEQPHRGVTVIEQQADRIAYTPADVLKVSGEVENLATTDAQGFTIDFAIDGTLIDSQTSIQLLRPDEVASFTHELPLTGLKEGAHELQTSIDGQQTTLPFYIYETTYGRKVLLEHFTSLPCVNCPRDDAKLEEACEGRSDVVWVGHHVGYRDDEFTLEAERTLTRYGVNGNPFIMLDRTAFSESEPPAFVISNYTATDVGSIFDYAAAIPAFATLSVSDATVTDGALSVNVTGEGKAFLNALFPRASLHLYVVEDQVKAEGSQAGDANKKLFDNILRHLATPIRGSIPTWETADNGKLSFQKQFDIALDASWNTANLRVVAFLTAQAATGTGYPTGEVLNATQLKLSEAAAISSIISNTQATHQWFTLDGRRIKAPQGKGIYIQQGRKIIIK